MDHETLSDISGGLRLSQRLLEQDQQIRMLNAAVSVLAAMLRDNGVIHAEMLDARLEAAMENAREEAATVANTITCQGCASQVIGGQHQLGGGPAARRRWCRVEQAPAPLDLGREHLLRLHRCDRLPRLHRYDERERTVMTEHGTICDACHATSGPTGRQVR